jgi:Tfp pilus assembly protein PilX
MTTRHHRRGAALFLTLVTLAIVTLIAAEVLRSMIAAQRQSRLAADELQAQWLAESAVAKALVQSRSQPEYQGETWRADIGDRAGVAEIRVERSSDGPSRIVVETRFPDHPWRRVAVSRTYPISPTSRTSGNEDRLQENMP